MALSMKNTFISLSLSGVMLVTGFLAGEQPTISQSTVAVAHVSPIAQQNKNVLLSSASTKKTKRAFTTPYFSFKRSSLSVGVR